MLFDRRGWLMGKEALAFTYTSMVLQTQLALTHSPTTTAWETAVSLHVNTRSCAPTRLRLVDMIAHKHDTCSHFEHSQNYAAWWISHYGLKWACYPVFGAFVTLQDVVVGLVLGVPAYWAWSRRIRPVVHQHLHRSGRSEEDVRQWAEQQLVLAVEIVSLEA